MKVCRWCLETLPLDVFPRSKDCKDGHENRCRVCKEARARARRGDLPLDVVDTRRFPFAPLMHAIGLPAVFEMRPGHGNGAALNVAARFNVTLSVLEHAIGAGSVSAVKADEMAVAAGLHPQDVWPEWWKLSTTAAA